MSFAGVSYLSIIVAAIASFAWGAAWPSPAPFIISFAALLIMGWVMAGIIGHIGATSVWPGIVTGFLLWLGFIATTLAVNHRYENFGWDLTLIDGGHWLGVALIMGAIIGWWAG